MSVYTLRDCETPQPCHAHPCRRPKTNEMAFTATRVIHQPCAIETGSSMIIILEHAATTPVD